MFDIADKAFTTWVTQKSARTSFFAVITPNDTWALRSRADASAIERPSKLDGPATWLRRETPFYAPQSGWCAPSRRLQEVGLGDSYSATTHRRSSGSSLLCTHTPYLPSHVIATSLWASDDTTLPYGAKMAQDGQRDEPASTEDAGSARRRPGDR